MIKVLSGWAFPSGGFNQINGLPLIRIRDLGRETTEVKFEGRYDDRYVVQDGDVLIGMDGDFAVKKWNGGLALLNQRVCKVKSITQELDQGFLYWYLMPHVAEIHRKTPQTTVRHLSAPSLYEIVNPPIPACEQRVVSLILDTLDSTIRQTEAIIEKLKQVKQGLLHDLLTRGIDANGELRPPLSQAPHLYKNSPLGWIPKDWHQVSLGDMLAGIDGGWSPECIEQSPNEGQWGVLKVSAISSGTYRPFESKTLPPHLQPDTSIEVGVGDVLLARANGVADLVAVTAYVDATPSCLMLSDKTLRLRPNLEALSGRFLATLMSFHTIRKQIGGMLNGSSGQRNISQGQIADLSIVLPSLTEQLQINNQLLAVTERIALELAVSEKLHKQKNGLMDDLLTGRVRVTPLLDSINV